MSSSRERERRRYGRCAVALEVLVQEYPDAVPTNQPAGCILGHTRNISNGGLYVVWDQLYNPSSLLKCEIFLPGFSITIPTLVHVCWFQEEQGKSGNGLEFLLR
jgi:PilZ domain